jgi:hypothetical protein
MWPTAPAPRGTDPALGREPHEAAPAFDPGQSTERQSPSTEPASTGFSSARPFMTIGAAGDDVAELGHLLAAAGFTNAVSEGKSGAPPILNDALMEVVRQFQEANGINPWQAENGEGQPLSSQHLGCVDARTWEALLGHQPAFVATGAQV